MARRLVPVSFLLALGAAPLAAQVIPAEGRWRVLIHATDPDAESMRGELRLADSAGVLSGTLRLETDSGPPLPLSRARRPAPDSIDLERLAQGPLALVGRWNGIAWAGPVTRAGRTLGRWEAVALDEGEEFYPAPPSFILRQTLLGSPARATRVPGPWLAAARARLDSLVRREEHGERWLLGLVERREWRDGLARDLARLRSRVEGEEQARFDALFGSPAGWVVDLHDAALLAARRRRPTAASSDWAPALAASGLAPPGAGEPELLEAAWRLWSLADADSAAFRLRLEAVRAADPSGGGLPAMLQAYEQAAAWHLEATAFLARLLDPVREPARLALAPIGAPGTLPAGALDPALAGRLVVPANWEGEGWLARHGAAGLTRAISRLVPEYGEAAVVDLGEGRLTLAEPAAELRDGRLGVTRTVRYDPGEAPLLAALRVVAEMERARLLTAWWARPAAEPAGTTIFLPDPEPHLADGMAELAADFAADGLPWAARANATRRALVADRAVAERSALGLALVRALADGLGHTALDQTREVVAGLGYDWSALATRPALARACVELRDAPAGELPPGRGPMLLPELHFEVESGAPRVTAVRVHSFQ